jgi:hypothetical protein
MARSMPTYFSGYYSAVMPEYFYRASRLTVGESHRYGLDSRQKHAGMTPEFYIELR